MSGSPLKYLCYNGDFITAGEPVLQLNNRSFRYGDALFESIHACGTEAQFLDLHLNRLKQSMEWLKMTVPSFFTPANIAQLITKLLNKNRIFGGACIRLTVFRNPGSCNTPGLYAPENNTVSYTLESEILEFDHYSLNPHGLVIDLFTEMPKPVHRLSSIKSTSGLLYVMAGIYQTEKGLDDCILINEKGHLVESGNSNIFLIREGHILTPGLEEGCLPGIMRQVLIPFFRINGQHFSENVPLVISDLLAADEVFLTNAIAGIRWVGAFQHKRYYRDISRQLLEQLNQLAFG
jgi:branched-subunit amino acid aminotransferase/4-amino-4-deoxychorismate lyase